MRRWLGLFLFAMLVVLPSGRAGANAGPIEWPPDAVGEPAAELGAIAVVHETLAIDLRPAAGGGRAGVPIDVVYRLDNKGPAVTIPTAFASPAMDEANVTLDGVRIDARPHDVLDNPAPPLPAHWGDAIPGGLRRDDAVWFDLEIAPGEHELHVRYVAGPGGDLHERPGTTTVDYLLAPARDWSSFGTLEIRVFVPPKHSVEITPPLTAAGSGALVGQFEGLPADLVQIRMRKDVGVLQLGLLFLLVVVGVAALAVFGQFTARGIVRSGAPWVALRVVGAPVLAAALAIGWFNLYDYVDRTIRGPYAGYESLGTLALAVLLAFVGTATAAVWGIRLRRQVALD